MHKEHKLVAVRAAAVMGERVGIFADSFSAAQAILPEVEALPIMADIPGVVRRLVHGRHSLEFQHGGGSIVFLSLRSEGQRGMSLDRAYVPIGTAGEKLRDLLPCLSVSGGPLVGY